MLILRLSEPAELPIQFEGMAKNNQKDEPYTLKYFSESGKGEKSLENNCEPRNKEVNSQPADADSDHYMLVKKIGVVKTVAGFRISFRASNVLNDQLSAIIEKINLNINFHECQVFLEALRSKAHQAGWDIDAGLRRVHANQRKQKAKAKPVLH